ncbi:anthrone oxygenase family protein [Paenibacillus jiagnxiensis]|uniref:anthrone oxygenase family protein n=1 Tax=Paenibacillus jiagnxiensis TaxID=3228926 RepID=UPI0033B3C364
MTNLFYYLTFAAALGSGLLAGIFFAFSTFVMTALSRLPAGQSIYAMQSINDVIVKSSFIVVFMGTTALCLILGIVSCARFGTAGAGYVLAGCLCIIVGAFLVTAIFNVPLNNELATITPGSSDAAGVWGRYIAGWMPWNHVRTMASIAALVLFVIALRKY